MAFRSTCLTRHGDVLSPGNLRKACGALTSVLSKFFARGCVGNVEQEWFVSPISAFGDDLAQPRQAIGDLLILFLTGFMYSIRSSIQNILVESASFNQIRGNFPQLRTIATGDPIINRYKAPLVGRPK